MDKKLSEEMGEANKLVQEISQKLKLKPVVSLKLIKDAGVLGEVSEEVKNWGCFLIPFRFQENFAPIFISDNFFRNKRFWKRLLAHECGHIKTFYNGLPYFYLKGVEEDLPAFFRKAPITLDIFSNQFSKYEDLGDLYGVAQQIIFSNFRERLHDNLANKEAMNATFAYDYALFAESELERFLDLKFIKQPYISKLILLDLSEKAIVLDGRDESKCRDVVRKFNEFFEVLEKFRLLGYVENCKRFFSELKFTTNVNQMEMYYKSGLAILTESLLSSELKECLNSTLLQLRGKFLGRINQKR